MEEAKIKSSLRMGQITRRKRGLNPLSLQAINLFFIIIFSQVSDAVDGQSLEKLNSTGQAMSLGTRGSAWCVEFSLASPRTVDRA